MSLKKIQFHGFMVTLSFGISNVTCLFRGMNMASMNTAGVLV